MSSTFEVSFIVPNFNSGNLLKATVDSITAKQFNFSYEILVIDGESTDESILFLNSNKLKRLTFISEKDENVYDAMNKGILLSQGEWLHFLGAGDLLSDTFSDFTFQHFDNNLIIYGNVYWVSKNTIYDGYFSLKKLFYKNICQQAIFYNRDCFKKYGLFDLGLNISADYKFNLKIFINSYSRVRFFDKIICNYKGNGISHINNDYFSKIKNYYILSSLIKSYKIENLFLILSYSFYLVINKVIYIFKK